MSEAREKSLSDQEVMDWLEINLPTWHLEDGMIRRIYETRGWKGVMMLAGAVGHLAEVAWHHPDMLLKYNSVEVRLMTHSAGGITRKDLELARKIEDVIFWQPAREESALEGTPLEARHAYIKHD